LLIKALNYKPKGRGFDSPWSHRYFYVLRPSGHTMAVGLTQALTEWVPKVSPSG